MSPDDPRHGTPAGAVAHNKDGEPACDACRRAGRRARIERELDQLAGNPRRAPLGRRAHAVIARVPRPQLSDATGIPRTALNRLLNDGPDAIVTRRTRERLLAAASANFWTPVGVQRRLRALHAIGWSMDAVATETGLWNDALRRLMRRERMVFVRTAFAEAIVEAYDRLSMIPREGNGATRARNRATELGWAPPLAWEDIDDPDAVPDLGAPDVRNQNGSTPTFYMLEDAEFLADDGRNLTYVCERLGVKRETFHSTCRREHQMDLYWRLANREPDAENLRATRDGMARAKRAVA